MRRSLALTLLYAVLLLTACTSVPLSTLAAYSRLEAEDIDFATARLAVHYPGLTDHPGEWIITTTLRQDGDVLEEAQFDLVVDQSPVERLPFLDLALQDRPIILRLSETDAQRAEALRDRFDTTENVSLSFLFETHFQADQLCGSNARANVWTRPNGASTYRRAARNADVVRLLGDSLTQACET